MADLARWNERLATLAREHGVPGASLAVLADDTVFATACGLANVRSGVEVTPDCVFQMGSITKVFTTTLVMQLVDEGKLDLDAHVADALPGFGLADAAAAARITLRQLLTHTSGIDGDQFVDCGRGDDAVARFVEHLHGVGLLHAPGERFSYCNAGFVVAGRIVELLRGAPFDAVLRERLLRPLGMRATGTLPEHALLGRAAIGHWPDPETGKPKPVPIWNLQPSNVPAGSVPFTTATELLAFARLHLDDGLAPDGTRIVSAESARAMRTREVELRTIHCALADAWGIGWAHVDGVGGTLIGHGGATLGQNAWLDLRFDRRVALALLTNGGDVATFSRAVRGELLREIAGMSLRPAPAIDASIAVDPARYAGVYERAGARFEVVARDGGIGARIRAIWYGFPADPPLHPLEPTGPDTFAMSLPASATPMLVGFSPADPSHAPRFLEATGRAHVRI